ncbi:lin2494 [Listeria innocua Clip11262]|uniref:Lin2494 protein n=1 Tax=Listeria innocua serovar 6a (strain ATCC BAA-680 / CLIP 11262) TaxID=272626 RepID=Q928N8_LISIN|nr:lin2494 [Listeria innocua Clip11262]
MDRSKQSELRAKYACEQSEHVILPVKCALHTKTSLPSKSIHHQSKTLHPIRPVRSKANYGQICIRAKQACNPSSKALPPNKKPHPSKSIHHQPEILHPIRPIQSKPNPPKTNTHSPSPKPQPKN